MNNGYLDEEGVRSAALTFFTKQGFWLKCPKKDIQRESIIPALVTLVSHLSLFHNLFILFFFFLTVLFCLYFPRIFLHNAAKSDLPSSFQSLVKITFQKSYSSNPAVNLHLHKYLKCSPIQRFLLGAVSKLDCLGWELSSFSVPYSPDPPVELNGDMTLDFLMCCDMKCTLHC